MYKIKEEKEEYKDNEYNAECLKFQLCSKFEFIKSSYYSSYKACISKLNNKKIKCISTLLLCIFFVVGEILLSCLVRVKTIHKTDALKYMMFATIFYVGLFLFFNFIGLIFFIIDYLFEKEFRYKTGTEIVTLKALEAFYFFKYNEINELLNDIDTVINKGNADRLLEIEIEDRNSKETILDYYESNRIKRYIVIVIMDLIFMFIMVNIL